MEKRDHARAAEREIPEAEEAQAALDRRTRERVAMSAREFVSDRDALEDAWAGSGKDSARDEGW
jgi:hypothetical protein